MSGTIPYFMAAHHAGAVEEPLEGGGGPDWVLDNAKIDIDLVGGSPQGRAWTETDGEVAVDTLLGTDANTGNAWDLTEYDPQWLTADGYPYQNDPPAFIGALRDLVLSGCTLRIKLKQVDDSPSSPVHLFMAFSTDGGSGVQFDGTPGVSNRDVTIESWTGPVDGAVRAFNRLEGGFNTIAFTFTNSRFEYSANGCDPVICTLTDEDSPAADPFISAMLDPNSDQAIQRITAYDTLPTSAGLSTLSAQASNTAPTNLAVLGWYPAFAGGTVSAATINGTGVQNLVQLTADDAEGNPVICTVQADPSGLMSVVSGDVIRFNASGTVTPGDYDFTIRATDPGGLFTEQEFTLTVTA